MARSRMMDHEKLEVYQRARAFNRRIYALLSALRTVRIDLVDQLQRAAASVLLNLAEGAGEYSRKEKARFYRMARRSATECAAILDLLVDNQIVGERDVEPLLEDLTIIVSMLVRLAGAAQAAGPDGRK
jgi:four helix bundle protein